MGKVKVIKGLLKGIGSLFKSKGEKVPALFKTTHKDPELTTRAFFTNLLDEFGETEVKEATRITKQAWSDNMFFPADVPRGPQGASFQDDLINLLEARHMSSSRLQASPISFARRGSGAADRYMIDKSIIKDKGFKRYTDMPGGPGDPKLYKNNWGEMSSNTNMEGKKIYSGSPSVLKEYSDDVIKKIKSNKNVSPEDIDLAYDEKMMARIRSGVDEELGILSLGRKQMVGGAHQANDMKNRMLMFEKKGDWESARKIEKAVEDFRLEVQGLKPGEPFPILTDPTRKPNAAGGRVGLAWGGMGDKQRESGGRTGMGTSAPGVGTGAGGPADGQTMNPNNVGVNPNVDNIDLSQIEKLAANYSPDFEDINQISSYNPEEFKDTNVLKDLFNQFKQYNPLEQDFTFGDENQFNVGYDVNPLNNSAALNAAYSFNQGGRVGMFAGGKLIGEGIMQAAKLAQKGIRPWGSKQIHRQNVKKMGASNFDTIDKITKTDVTSLADARDPEGLIRMYEDVLSGRKYGILSDPQRQTVLETIEDGFREISGDKSFLEDIGADLSNMKQYYSWINTPKKSAKILPFKPRQKKFKGGIMQLLKRTVNPKSIKAASETKGPFKTGHRADYIADADQLKSIIRKEATDLDDIHGLEDMIQNDPRYGEQARSVFLRLIQREKLRANMIFDDPRAAKWAEADSEGFDRFLEQILKNDPTAGDFNQGGQVGVGSLFRRKA